jgi:hypothetical protein
MCYLVIPQRRSNIRLHASFVRDKFVWISSCMVLQTPPLSRAFSLLQADATTRKRVVKGPPADIRRYLKATGMMETRYIRMLSSLCNETYYLNKLSVSTFLLPVH